MGGFAWVTLATNDSYSLGALVLAHSLRQVNTAHQLAVLITPAVSEAMRNQLGSIFDVVKIVDVLDSKDEANLALLKRPELGITFTKLHCWQLTQFEKGVFLDADTLVVRNCDELFEREEFSAAPDVGWPDCFNSGVFVFRPSVETFNNLIQFAVEKGSFDGGDQGLLNQFFNTWATDDIRKHLPFVYNLTSVAVYSYIPAFKQYGAESRIVHFIGPVKPWLQAVDPATRTVTPSADSTHLQPLLQQWWDIFIAKVHPGLSTDLECASGMLTFFAQPACSQDPLDCTHARSDPFPPPPPPPEPQAPDFPDPYTPYIEKDDERQYNLPYQPFQVVSSEGELLNITFADFVRESEPKEAIQEFLPEPEPQVPEESSAPEPEPEPEPEPQPKEEERHFDYHQFVPDETVINAYLEHNVQEYQPFDLNQSGQTFDPLPRFLTIPEDDSRQSQKPYEPEPCWHQPEEIWTEPHHVHDRAPSPVPAPVITKSQSMTNLLVVDATNTASFQNLTAWKSQPDVGLPVEVPKKLPGLKPLLPKVTSPFKSLSSPKYTEFTEVNMNLDYSDPFAPPVDNIGFVERAILSKGKTLHPVSVPTPPPQPTLPHFHPFQPIPEMNQYVDLSECQRQAGNAGDQAPVTSGGLKTFTPKISPRRMKRSTRRVAEKWKPPETTNAMYDVDEIVKRLSQFSIGYAPPTLPEVQQASETETRADRFFRGSALETRSAADAPSNGLPADNELVKKKSHFGPLAYSSPFAAYAGESLSEFEDSVPEIVVCVASPENVTNGILWDAKSRTETEDDTFSTPVGDMKLLVNGTNRTSSSEDSFLSAVSGTSVDMVALTEKVGNMRIDEGDLGIAGVKEWEEILEAQLLPEKPVAEDVDISWPRTSNHKECSNVDSPETEKPTALLNFPIDTEDAPSANTFEEVFELAIDTQTDDIPTAETLTFEKVFTENGGVSIDSIETTTTLLTPVENSSEVLSDSEKIVEAVATNNDEALVEKTCGTTSESGTLRDASKKFEQLPIVEHSEDAVVSQALETAITVANSQTVPISLKTAEAVSLLPMDKPTEDAFISQTLETTFENTETVSVSPTKATVEVALTPIVEPTEDAAILEALDTTYTVEESEKVPSVAVAQEFSCELKPISVSEFFSTLNNRQPTEDAAKLPPMQINQDVFSNLVTSSPTAGSDPFNASYAAAVKKSSAPLVKPVEPVRTVPKPQTLPKQNGLKRPRKPKKAKPAPITTEVKTEEAQPVKYNKRKMEKPECEFPVNRFELLPEETHKLTHPQKKPKKSKKFAAPVPSSLPACSSSVVRDDEEEATPHLPEPDDNPGIAGAIAQLNLEPGSAEADPRSSAAQAEYLRRQSWETGKVDYMGRDSFANVWSKISETLSQSPIPENPSSATAPDVQAKKSDSIETLPSDATLSPGEAADDDIIFDRPPDSTESSNILPGILEECEEPVEDTTSSDKIENPSAPCSEVQTNSAPLNIEEGNKDSDETSPPPSPPIGSDSSAFATYKPVKEPDPVPTKQLSRQSSSEEKRGVFTKILEFVGVVKKKEEVETSIFYDEPSPPLEEPEESSGVEGIQEILKATDLSTIDDGKKRSPSPRVKIAAVPETVIIAATPPTQPDQKPPRRDPEALTVDSSIPETPPVVEKKTPIFVDRDSLLEDIDGIIKKAKMIAEDELSPAPVFCVAEAPKPPIAVLEEFEEIRVTSDEEKQRTVKQTSKLSEQILKAIPPPRRKAISDAKNQQSVSVQVEKALDVVSEQPPPVPPRRRNRSKQRADK